MCVCVYVRVRVYTEYTLLEDPTTLFSLIFVGPKKKM